MTTTHLRPTTPQPMPPVLELDDEVIDNDDQPDGPEPEFLNDAEIVGTPTPRMENS